MLFISMLSQASLIAIFFIKHIRKLHFSFLIQMTVGPETQAFCPNLYVHQIRVEIERSVTHSLSLQCKKHGSYFALTPGTMCSKRYALTRSPTLQMLGRYWSVSAARRIAKQTAITPHRCCPVAASRLGLIVLVRYLNYILLVFKKIKCTRVDSNVLFTYPFEDIVEIAQMSMSLFLTT